jgi:MFS family permease
LTENASTYTSKPSNGYYKGKQELSKSIDIKGVVSLSAAVICFLITLQLLEKTGGNDLIQIIIFAITSVISVFAFVAIEKKAPSPLINFKLLKNRTILSANIINMTVGLTALMVVYQTLPILIQSPTPLGFGGDSSSIAIVQLPYMIVSLLFSVASGFIVSKFGNLKPTTIGTIVTTLGFFVLFLYHSTESSIAAVLAIVAVGLALMQIGSVNIVLTSTPKQFSGISLGMNLLIYLIGSSVGPVIAGIYLQANQVSLPSVMDSLSSSFPSPESYNLVFLTAVLISASSIIFAILLNRSVMKNSTGDISK